MFIEFHELCKFLFPLLKNYLSLSWLQQKKYFFYFSSCYFCIAIIIINKLLFANTKRLRAFSQWLNNIKFFNLYEKSFFILYKKYEKKGKNFILTDKVYIWTLFFSHFNNEIELWKFLKININLILNLFDLITILFITKHWHLFRKCLKAIILLVINIYCFP